MYIRTIIRTLFVTLILGLLYSIFPQTDFISISPQVAKANTYNMSYVFYGNTPEIIHKVDATAGALQVISPNYWELATDGSLSISSAMDPAFITAMHKKNMKVVPFLGNDWNRALAEKALQNRDALSTQIANAINDYQLDGINVDLENITISSRDALIDFVNLLRTKLPVNKEVSIAVPANPLGLDGAYNIKALAAACDYIMLMTYDEHYPGDPNSGPVASLPFVEKSIQYALTQIPSSQLVLGIPFYGRFWNGQAAYNGAAIPNELASTLAAKYGGTETYDLSAQSIRSEFTIHADDPRTQVFAQSLPNGNYTLWYENEQSIKAKLSLVQKYNLKGTGSWSLNQATADTWSYYNIWSNGQYYSDLQNNWSQQAAIEITNKGWMVGISATQFAPDQPLTRAQASVIMARALANNSTFIKAQLDTASINFNDVPKDYWAFTAISSMAKSGILTGIGNQLFAPDAPMTREEISVLLSRILKLQASTTIISPFSDVDLTRWSYPAIAALSANQILFGYEDGSFHPKELISRAQMAALLFRIQDKLAS
jgi:spore germination protein YaaH